MPCRADLTIQQVNSARSFSIPSLRRTEFCRGTAQFAVQNLVILSQVVLIPSQVATEKLMDIILGISLDGSHRDARLYSQHRSASV
jgi:hypothetical protein